MAIDATLSGPDANSYLTLEEANAYFAQEFGAEAWETATDGDKEKALLTACRRIETLRLRVNRTALADLDSVAVTTQRLAFPRLRDLNTAQAYIVPDAVKQAQCQEALALLAFGAEASRRGNLQAQGVTAFQTEGLSETYAQDARQQHTLLSAPARRLIARYIERGGYLQRSEWPWGEQTPGSSR